MDGSDAGDDETPAVVVVGSANVDRTLRVDRLPRPGETVTGTGPDTAPGGKGLNQAVAARRMGATVAFVGALGGDEDGDLLRRRLTEERITDATLAVEVATGGATITVDAGAENTIVVTPGANWALDEDDIAAAAALVGPAAVLLTQLEIPVPAVTAALRVATGTRILTPAPARPLGRDVLDHVDVLLPNRGELLTLAGVGAGTTDDLRAGAADRGGDDGDRHAVIAAAARSLGVPVVLVTLGGDGALLITDDRVEHVPALPVDAADTTGAGDTFAGALAAGLASGAHLREAVASAAAAAALSVTGRGAQAAMPLLDAVRQLQADAAERVVAGAEAVGVARGGGADDTGTSDPRGGLGGT